MSSLYKKILVPFDFSDNGRQALRMALLLSHRFGSDLHILGVIERDPHSEALKSVVLPKDSESRLKKKIQEETHSAISWAERSEFHFQPMVKKGKPALEILLAAEKEKPDLIVMGTKGRTGLQHILLGSVAEKVVRRAGVPVWVCRGSSRNLPQKILVPVDFSDNSRQALDLGVKWARELNAELFVLHVVDLRDLYTLDPLGLDTGPALEAQLKKQAEDQLHDWTQSLSYPAKREVRLGSPGSEIQNAVLEKDIELVILSTHGRTGLKHVMMGSIAEETVRYSSCSVMTICPTAIALSRIDLFASEADFEEYVKSFRDE